MSTRLMAGLRELPDRVTLHGEIRPRNLYECGRDRGHDQCEEERITLLPPCVDVRHKRRFVHARRQWINKVEKEGNNEENGIARRNVFQPVRAVVVRKWGYNRWRENGEGLILLVRPVVEWVCAELVRGRSALWGLVLTR